MFSWEWCQSFVMYVVHFSRVISPQKSPESRTSKVKLPEYESPGPPINLFGPSKFISRALEKNISKIFRGNV